MKILRAVLFVGLLLSLSCINTNNDIYYPSSNNCIDGHGAIVSETRTVDNFHSINSIIVADILLIQGPQEDLIIEAQPNILQLLKTEVINGELRLTFNQCVDIQERVKIYITTPDLKKLTLIGVGDFITQNDFDLTELDIVLTGVGDFRLRGTASKLDITLTGVGDVKTFDLLTGSSDIKLTGVGNVEVFVNDQLNVILTGVGKVYYKGDPSITANIIGAGSIIDAN